MYVYIWSDPKFEIHRYVGKGADQRVWEHIENHSGTRTANMLAKRHREGFVCIPRIFEVDSNDEAKELEIFLIAEIGRTDLGFGPLWNLTDGGEGIVNPGPEIRAKLSKWQKGKPKVAHSPESYARGMKVRMDRESPEQRRLRILKGWETRRANGNGKWASR